MKINAELVLKLRNEKSWSQDELAIASGLNLRTIQRIEKEASASLQSKKALASALEVTVRDLDYGELPTMKKYEYKSVPVKFNFGWFKKGTFNLDDTLNEEGSNGWQLKQLIMPTDATEGSEQMVVILEREVFE